MNATKLYRKERDLRRRLQAKLIEGTPLDSTQTQPDYMPIRSFHQEGATRTYVVFGSLSAGDTIDQLELFGVTRDTGQSRVFVSDFMQLWYQDGLLGLTQNRAETITLLRTYLAQFPRPFTFVGSSAGGYAALLFGHALEAERIVAFSAQTVLNAKVMREFGPLRSDDRSFDNADPYTDLLPLFQETPAAGRVELHFGRKRLIDRRHALRMADCENLHLFPHELNLHNIARRLHAEGKLSSIIRGTE